MSDSAALVANGRSFRLAHEEELSESDVTKARLELNETPEIRQRALRTLKSMLAADPDLHSRVDDEYLLQFLRVRKFNCDRTLRLIRDHYSIRAKYPALFPAPSKVENLLRAGLFTYLPYRDQEGRTLVVVKMGAWHPAQFSFWDAVSVVIQVAECVLDNPVSQVNGTVALWDVRDFSVGHFLQMANPKRLALICSLIQDFYPVRLKMVYGVNTPPLAKSVWNLIKPFMSDKLRNRVQLFGSDLSELHRWVDPSILPEEYGGQLPPCDPQKTVQRVLDREQDFQYSRKFGYVGR